MTHQSTAQERPMSARERFADFTRRIEKLCADDPGARTALRTGLRRGLDGVPRMHRFVVPELPRGGRIPAAQQRAYYAVASMIAAQPRHTFADAEPETNDTEESSMAADSAPEPTPEQKYGSSLGRAFATAVATSPARDRAMRESAAESRLNLLTRQSTNGLHRHLPAAVRFLCDVGVDVDWPRLLADLIAWPVDAQKVARYWLQDYYMHRANPEWQKADSADQDETGQQSVPA